jgi:TonB-dependent SusC/RagA subfamily outer membrane receptor
VPAPDRSTSAALAPALVLATSHVLLLALAACASLGPAPAPRAAHETSRAPRPNELETAAQWPAQPARSLGDFLLGRFAGVQVRTEGGETFVQIRGVSTLLGDGRPLVVLDGYPLPAGGRALGLVNPYDVERVEVLKDAASLAQWGVRGGNGVIVVTTKQAR